MVVETPSLDITDAPDDPGDLIDHLGELGDGLPVIPPTEERVRRFLDSWGKSSDEEIAIIPPGMGLMTAEKLAVNAIMAGCEPSYLPILESAVKAFCEPEFNLPNIQITSNPSTYLVIVNGPVRHSVGINSAGNCMGHGARANVTIGRAVRMALQNIGVCHVGKGDKACQGFPGRISFCFGENEEASPWDSLHAERGFNDDQSAVTVVAAQGTSNIIFHGRPCADDLLPTLAHGMMNPGANNYCLYGGEPVVVLNPGHARVLSQDGIGKSELRNYLYEHARVPVRWYPDRSQEVSKMSLRAVDGALPVAASPEHIVVVVAGDAGSHSTFIPTFGETSAITREVGSSIT